MGHPHRQHWKSAPRGTINQSFPGHVDRKLAPVGWQLCPLLSVYNIISAGLRLPIVAGVPKCLSLLNVN